MNKLRLTAGGVLLALVPFAWFQLAAAAQTPAHSKTRPTPPDVVLITIDTLRADALGFAGNPRVQTPVLDRLAAAGRVFPNAHAHNVVTLPSHTNILTGLYPYQHGVRDNTGFQVKDSIPTLATVLREAGYATGAFVSAFPLDSQFGLDRGFQVYDDRYTEGSEADEFVMPERRGDQTLARALEWWNQQRGKPRFLWVHLFDPHAAYDPPEPFASRFRQHPYLGEVSAVDSFLSPLLTPLLDGKEPSALVVVTSDHGEALGEHGELTHGLFAYEATLRVPLVVWGPGIQKGRDLRWARHVDIFPTVIEVTGTAAPAVAGQSRPGRSLLASAAPGKAAPVDSYFESLSSTLNRGWAPLRGLLRGGRKYIALPLPEAYDLPSDPGETRNLVDAERAAARAAFAALPKESVWPPERGTISAEEEARLRSLGYLSSSAPARASYGPEDDPKRLVDLDRKVHRIIDLYSTGKVQEAVKLGREVVAERPSMALGHSLLAQALLEAGDRAAALEVMQQARAQRVATDSMLRQLGLTLAETGRGKDAIAVLEPLAKTGDVRSGNALALAYSEAGRQEDAREALRQVLAKDPGNAKAYENLGLIDLRLGRWAPARDHSRRAVDLSPGLFLAWNNLGVALYQLQQPLDALDAWQRAVDLKPDLWDALWNLGTKALQHGRTQQGRAALERFVAGAPEKQYAADIQRARGALAQLAGSRGGAR